MKRVLLIMAIFMATVTGVSAKGGLTVKERLTSEQDTIVIKMANGAKMILQLKNKEQLKSFQNYSLDSLMQVLNVYVTRVDSIETANPESKEVTATFNTSEDGGAGEIITITMNEAEAGKDGKKKKTYKFDIDINDKDDDINISINEDNDQDDEDTTHTETVKEYKATKFGFTIDVGLSNFLNTKSDQLPDLKPTGSRYVSLNSTIKSQIGGEKSPVHILSGVEFAFYNYMFDDNMIIQDIDNQTSFIKSERNLEKTKLTHSAVNVPLMVQLKFKRKNNKDGFQIGAGGFAGYGLGAHAKLKYEEDGKTQKDKIRDSYNLTNFQYGLKASIGYGSLNLFAKYNMNDLFKENRGPQANVISFGFTLLN